jgi:hypothetical protein
MGSERPGSTARSWRRLLVERWEMSIDAARGKYAEQRGCIGEEEDREAETEAAEGCGKKQ